MSPPRATAAILESFNVLHCSERERDLLHAMLGPAVHHAAGTEIVAAGEVLDKPTFIAAGWIVNVVRFLDGRRQVIEICLPGDLVGHCSRTGARSFGAMVCLTDVATVGAQDLLRSVREKSVLNPGLAEACRILEEQQEQRLVAQIIRLGHQQARERMASLIWELYGRLQRCGLVVNGSFTLPATQEVLGDVLGLSTVHVNRTLQQLRRDGLISLIHGRLEVLDPGRLAEIAGPQAAPRNGSGLPYVMAAKSDAK